jgi:hypothetical protein
LPGLEEARIDVELENAPVEALDGGEAVAKE